MNALRELFIAGLLAGVLGDDARASAFRVSPNRLDFGPVSRAASVTVSNDEGMAQQFQLRLMRWSQNAGGDDVFEESEALAVSPRLITVEPRGQALVRVDLGPAPEPSEATYRLIIEEVLPHRGSADPSDVRMRYVVPVFVAPAHPSPKPVIERLAVGQGEVRLTLRNAGNRHLRTDWIALHRGEELVQKVGGGYVLAGAQRVFRVPIPAWECTQSGPVVLRLKGDGIELRREIMFGPGTCGSGVHGSP